MVMGVFVRLLACLPIRVSLCFFGWLVVGVYVCLCVFRHFAVHFHVLFALWDVFFAFLALWGALRLHCNAWGSTLPPLVTYFCMFFVLGGTLGLSLLICGLRLGTFWGLFWYDFLGLWPDPGPLCRVFWKRLEKGSKKKRKRELKWM